MSDDKFKIDVVKEQVMYTKVDADTFNAQYTEMLKPLLSNLRMKWVRVFSSKGNSIGIIDKFKSELIAFNWEDSSLVVGGRTLIESMYDLDKAYMDVCSNCNIPLFEGQQKNRLFDKVVKYETYESLYKLTNKILQEVERLQDQLKDKTHEETGYKKEEDGVKERWNMMLTALENLVSKRTNDVKTLDRSTFTALVGMAKKNTMQEIKDLPEWEFRKFADTMMQYYDESKKKQELEADELPLPPKLE